MAKGDIRVVRGKTSVQEWQTEAGATDIQAGEPVKLKVAGSPYVIPLADNEPVIGTTTQVIGVAQSASTHTSTADGKISVYIPEDDTVFGIAPTTGTNVDTQAELDALVGDRVLLDLVGSTYTLDENAGDAAANGVQIVGGIGTASKQEMWFKIRPAALEGPTA